MRDAAALPQAHPHVHLDACMRPSTLQDLAARDAGLLSVPHAGELAG